MNAYYIWLTIVLMGIVTYLPRVIPLLLLTNYKLPKWFELWLKFVPTTIFGALIFSEIFVRENSLNLNLNNISLLASVVVFIIALKTKSLAITILSGMILFWLLQNQNYFAVSF